MIHVPSLARLVARIPHAERLLEYIINSHTTHIDVILTHFVPVYNPSLTDEMWMEGTRAHFDGKIIVGKDSMEINLIKHEVPFVLPPSEKNGKAFLQNSYRFIKLSIKLRLVVRGFWWRDFQTVIVKK